MTRTGSFCSMVIGFFKKKTEKDTAPKVPITSRTLLYIFLLFFYSYSYTQSNRNIRGQISGYMESVRNDAALPDLTGLITGKNKEGAIHKALTSFYTDSVFEVRYAAYRLTYKIAIRSTSLAVRQQMVFSLTGGLKDNNRIVAGWIAGQLSSFNREDYTAETKNDIAGSLYSGAAGLTELVRVAGYLKMTETEDAIENIIFQSGKASQKWAAWLALARMGNPDYISKVMSFALKMKLNDDLVFDIIPGLIYTRQKQCLDYVIEILYNDQKACTSADPDNPTDILCGYRIMEYLAPVIKDFPFGVKASGDIDAKNYKEALLTIREWFRNKDSSYEIIDTSY